MTFNQTQGLVAVVSAVISFLLGSNQLAAYPWVLLILGAANAGLAVWSLRYDPRGAQAAPPTAP